MSYFKEWFDEDEKQALKRRVDMLKKDYSKEEMEKIICYELDEMGLYSEHYMVLMERVMEELPEEELS